MIAPKCKQCRMTEPHHKMDCSYRLIYSDADLEQARARLARAPFAGDPIVYFVTAMKDADERAVAEQILRQRSK